MKRTWTVFVRQANAPPWSTIQLQMIASVAPNVCSGALSTPSRLHLMKNMWSTPNYASSATRADKFARLMRWWWNNYWLLFCCREAWPCFSTRFMDRLIRNKTQWFGRFNAAPILQRLLCAWSSCNQLSAPYHLHSLKDTTICIMQPIIWVSQPIICITEPIICVMQISMRLTQISMRVTQIKQLESPQSESFREGNFPDFGINDLNFI